MSQMNFPSKVGDNGATDNASGQKQGKFAVECRF